MLWEEKSFPQNNVFASDAQVDDSVSWDQNETLRGAFRTMNQKYFDTKRNAKHIGRLL